MPVLFQMPRSRLAVSELDCSPTQSAEGRRYPSEAPHAFLESGRWRLHESYAAKPRAVVSEHLALSAFDVRAQIHLVERFQ